MVLVLTLLDQDARQGYFRHGWKTVPWSPGESTVIRFSEANVRAHHLIAREKSPGYFKIPGIP